MDLPFRVQDSLFEEPLVGGRGQVNVVQLHWGGAG